MTMRSIILLALVSLAIGSQIETYNDYLVFAAKNHFKSVSQYAGSVGLDQFDSQWEQFKIKFNKNFDKEHEEIRKFNFLKKLQFIKTHNEKFNAGLVSHSVDINQFADWSAEEFKAMMGEMPLINVNNTKGFLKPKLQSASLPRSFDWRSQGKVTAVKNQGQCGSCWAFSSVAAVESGFLINENRRTSLSEQELVDCSRGNNMGCRGGFTKDALLFVQEYGLETESQYPYYAQQGNCQYNEQRSSVNKIPKTYYIEPLATDQSMMDAVMNYGPITVAINADGNDFAHYRSGIISSGGRTITHAVVVVGWGPGYWIIKNSWGVTWGMNGFGYIAQNNNVRNINSQIFFPGWK